VALGRPDHRRVRPDRGDSRSRLTSSAAIPTTGGTRRPRPPPRQTAHYHARPPLFIGRLRSERPGRLASHDARIIEANGTTAASRKIHQNRLKELGKVTFDRIEVKPFAVKRFGTTFGLVVDAPDNNDDIWWVTAEPGDYMAFSAPWDSGEYDT
jgi:hypothetical protein